MITIFLSVTCYNVTMQNTKYYNEFFEFGQQKINFNWCYNRCVLLNGTFCTPNDRKLNYSNSFIVS